MKSKQKVVGKLGAFLVLAWSLQWVQWLGYNGGDFVIFGHIKDNDQRICGLTHFWGNPSIMVWKLSFDIYLEKPPWAYIINQTFFHFT
jgi:hypothetical protein